MNSAHQVVKISDVLAQLGDSSETVNGASESRDISSNITHTGDIDTMQHIKFTAMRIAVVTCKVKPPSADMMEMEVERQAFGLGPLKITNILLGTSEVVSRPSCPLATIS